MFNIMAANGVNQKCVEFAMSCLENVNMNLKSVWCGVGAVFTKKIESHNFCSFPTIFHKKTVQPHDV